MFGFELERIKMMKSNFIFSLVGWIKNHSFLYVIIFGDDFKFRDFNHLFPFEEGAKIPRIFILEKVILFENKKSGLEPKYALWPSIIIKMYNKMTWHNKPV